LFDRTPHAWRKIGPWSRRRDEFVKRAAFALLAGLAIHDKHTGDEPFLRSLALVERAATDERNFVKKGVSWGLRATGRRSPTVHAAAVETARRLAESTDAAARWVGKDALRDLMKPAVRRKLATPRREVATSRRATTAPRRAAKK
jgi:3-methyladenine DNA glycosylase AlkD